MNSRLLFPVVVLLAVAALMARAAEPDGPKANAPESRQAADSQQPRAVPFGLGRVHRGTAEIDLEILNHFGPQPQAAQNLFRAAREALGADPQGRFANNGAILQACRENGVTHLAGPMLGAVTADGARVWMRTIQPASVQVVVQAGEKELRFGPVASTIESDLVAIVPVTGLEPGTRYPYRVLVDDQPIRIPGHAAITTAPDPAEPSKVRIAFSGDFHKSGLHNPRLLNLVRQRGSLAMLLTGDLAADDRNNHVGLHRSDYLLRDLSPAWQDLVAAVPVCATWDDHDYFDNDLSGIPPGFTDADRRAVRTVWTQAWNNPSYGFGDEGGGIFLRTRIGPADVIMVDSRYFRDPARRKQAGAFLGDAQMEWLRQQLLDCQGPFVILTCGTMWSDYVSNGKDSWGVWDPEGREQIFRLIEENDIRGVLLLSCDRHGARGFRIPRPAGRTLYEFECGLLGAHLGPAALVPDCPEQLFGFEGIFAYGELELDTTVPEPTATFRLLKEDGTELYKIILTRKEL
jgi:alkaline phosphatase D